MIKTSSARNGRSRDMVFKRMVRYLFFRTNISVRPTLEKEPRERKQSKCLPKDIREKPTERRFKNLNKMQFSSNQKAKLCKSYKDSKTDSEARRHWNKYKRSVKPRNMNSRPLEMVQTKQKFLRINLERSYRWQPHHSWSARKFCTSREWTNCKQ